MSGRESLSRDSCARETKYRAAVLVSYPGMAFRRAAFSGLAALEAPMWRNCPAACAVTVAPSRHGRTIGAYDVLIAGQALRRKLTLVTANVKEFRRIEGLRWEDWGRV